MLHLRSVVMGALMVIAIQHATGGAIVENL